MQTKSRWCVYIYIYSKTYTVQCSVLQFLTQHTCTYGPPAWLTEVLEQQEIWPDMATIAAVHGTGGK